MRGDEERKKSKREREAERERVKETGSPWQDFKEIDREKAKADKDVS